MSDHLPGLDYDVTITSTSTVYDSEVMDVKLDADVKLTYGALMGMSKKPVAARSRAVYDRPAPDEFPEVSVAFVLDMSGSMNKNFSGQTRIDTLQQSISDLFEKIESANSDDVDLKTKLRTGIYAYNWGISDASSHSIADGWDHTTSRVADMQPRSETIPAQAMEVAVYDLFDEPKTAEGEDRHKILVYMTDGEVDDQLSMRFRYSRYHNYRGSPYKRGRQTYTERTLEVCRIAMELGMEVIAVGMNAPSEGVSLLQQCSEASDLNSVSSYYDNALNKNDFDNALSQILLAGSQPTARLLD